LYFIIDELTFTSIYVFEYCGIKSDALYIFTSRERASSFDTEWFHLSQSITASRSKEETKHAHRAVDNFSSCGNRCIATALAFSTAIDLLNLRNRSILDSSAFRVYGEEWQLNTQLRIVCSSCRSRVSGSAWSRKRRPSLLRESRSSFSRHKETARRKRLTSIRVGINLFRCVRRCSSENDVRFVAAPLRGWYQNSGECLSFYTLPSMPRRANGMRKHCICTANTVIIVRLLLPLRALGSVIHSFSCLSCLRLIRYS